MDLKRRIREAIPQKYVYTLLHLKKSLPFVGDASFKSYSGNGEDIILKEYLFKGKKNGFFVDVGAFHPKIISNTFLLSKAGWRGINIEPNPQAYKLFQKYRPKDINLKLGVAEVASEKTYYNFSYSGANTFDVTVGEQKSEKDWNTVISKEKLHCEPLKTILEMHVPANTEIDLLDIDVEGLDLEVLKSNDWNRFRPKVVLVEDKEFRQNPGQSDVYLFMLEQGYRFYSYLDITLVMVEQSFKRNSSI